MFLEMFNFKYIFDFYRRRLVAVIHKRHRYIFKIKFQDGISPRALFSKDTNNSSISLSVTASFLETINRYVIYIYCCEFEIFPLIII